MYPSLNGTTRTKIMAMAGVVLIHCNFLKSYSYTACIGTDLISFISVNLCKICVPLFFFLSGLLFFRNIEANIGRKLKSRLITVAIPYLLWNIAGLICFLAKRYLFTEYFPQYSDIAITPMNILRGFWSYTLLDPGLSDYPYDFVLWFVRNLIVVIPLSCLVYRLVGNGILWIAPLYILSILSMDYNPYGLLSAFCFFYCGGVLGSNVDKTLRKYMDSNRSRRTMFVIALASISGYIIWSILFPIGNALTTYMYFPVYIVTIIALVIFSEIISYNKVNINETLTARSLFFIYCCHGLWVSVASKLVTSLIHPDGTAGFLFSYILLFFLLWYLDMLIYVIFNRLTPSLVKVLTGGRS